jgi:N-acetyl-anhydromuramyl-L-alanine amidase AmpD
MVMKRNEFIESTLLKLREYGMDFSQAMEDEVKQALVKAWELGYREGQNDKIKEVDEFYGSR